MITKMINSIASSTTPLEFLKTFTITVFLTAMNFFDPIKPFIYILVIMNFIDMICGYLYFKIIKKDRFRKKKAFNAIFEMLIYMATICVLLIIGKLMDNEDEIYILMKVVVYGLLLLYSRNIAKNIHRTFPDNTFWSWAYFALSLQLFKVLPFGKEFKKKQEEDAIKAKQEVNKKDNKNKNER